MLYPTFPGSMNARDSIFAFLWLLLAAAVPAANPASQTVVGRSVYHPDNSRSETVHDMNVREMTETTYSSTNAVISKKVFLLNEKGEPVQGNIYDGRGNLVARAQCIYDEFGRRREDQLSNLSGVVFQRIIHEYDKNGKALTPKVLNLSQSPMIRPAAVDFTTPAAGVPAGAGSRFAPAPAADPAPAPAPTPNVEEPAKGNFFKRLFKKKD
jgi:hypothetical protein